jgi:hypothetical protein
VIKVTEYILFQNNVINWSVTEHRPKEENYKAVM